ncbi:uncharacterized protein BDW70DRAFT_165285 [Aspergillus foveolatus]|uniref:uncharacterized protein n=1 Tax=Aspergillus foveolatus TaxID=210207 RepID=UPI003CCE24CD
MSVNRIPETYSQYCIFYATSPVILFVLFVGPQILLGRPTEGGLSPLPDLRAGAARPPPSFCGSDGRPLRAARGQGRGLVDTLNKIWNLAIFLNASPQRHEAFLGLQTEVSRA